MNPRFPSPGFLVTALIAVALLAGACTTTGYGSPAASATTAPSVAGGAAALAVAAPSASPTPVAAPAAASAPPPASQSEGSALGLQRDFINVVNAINPSVVVIEAATGLGSGIVYDAAGHIVTNAHVTEGSTAFAVTLADGKQYRGTFVGSFADDDLAVIRINATGLRPATFADSSKLVVGDIVLAVGNPLGLQSSVTEGIVSALGRTVAESDTVALPNVIQTSAAINPGNSGGALVNLDGQVVGIPTLAAGDPQLGGAAVGIGFAIPSNTVTFIADQLIAHGRVVDSRRANLGVTVADLSSGAAVLVHSIVAGGPASRAGIVAGELITSVAGQPTPSAAAFADVLATLQPGQTVQVAVTRATGTSKTVSVTLGELAG